jgi:hypothetical protein
MSEYKGIKGFQVQTRTEDPSPTEAQAGDFYYNSSTGQFKNIITGGAPLGSWSSGGSLNNTRTDLTGTGTKAAGLAIGGRPGNLDYVEQYNGSSWSEIAEIGTGRYAGAAAGSPSAALYFGGYISSPPSGARNLTENWNGSSWTEVNELNSTIAYQFGLGTSTAAISAAGNRYSPVVANYETWDGTNWTAAGSMNAAKLVGARGLGTQTAGLAAGGYTPSTSTSVNQVEEFDGSSWSEITELNTGRRYSGGSGTSTSGLVISGNVSGPSAVTNCETWNGSSWTEVADVATGREVAGSSGNEDNSTGLFFGGTGGGVQAITEEWEAPDFEIKTVTTS